MKRESCDFSHGRFKSKDTKYKIFLGKLYWYNTNMSTSMWIEVNSNISLKEILNMKFTKVEYHKLKPMTFEKTVKTGKKIKYSYNDYTQDDFSTIQSVFKTLTNPMYDNETVSDIIVKGTWFAEGVYE